MTQRERRRTIQAIIEHSRFIAREEARAADTRPAETQKLLDRYKAKCDALAATLGTD